MAGLEMLTLGERDEEKLALLVTLSENASRGADLVKQFLSFARSVEGERTSVNLLDVG